MIFDRFSGKDFDQLQDGASYVLGCMLLAAAAAGILFACCCMGAFLIWWPSG